MILVRVETLSTFKEYDMDVFKELWNGTWGNYVPTDPTVRMLTEHFSELFRLGFVVIACSMILIPYFIVLDRRRMRSMQDSEVQS